MRVRRVAASVGCTTSDLRSGRFRLRPEKAQAVRSTLERIERLCARWKLKRRGESDLAAALVVSHDFVKEASHV